MRRRQGWVCQLRFGRGSQLPSTAWRWLTTVMMLCLLFLGRAAMTSAQVNTATLSGTVSDPSRFAGQGRQRSR